MYKELYHLLATRAIKEAGFAQLTVPEADLDEYIHKLAPELIDECVELTHEIANPDFLPWLLFLDTIVVLKDFTKIGVFITTNYGDLKLCQRVNHSKKYNRLLTKLNIDKHLTLLVHNKQPPITSDIFDAVIMAYTADSRHSYYDCSGYEYTQEDIEIEGSL